MAAYIPSMVKDASPPTDSTWQIRHLYEGTSQDGREFIVLRKTYLYQCSSSDLSGKNPTVAVPLA